MGTTHVHPHEAPGATAPGASPLLDIGGDVGALLVYLDGVTPSGELEACPAGRPDARFHTGVHLRELGGASVAVAVFPQIIEGSYQLLDGEGRPVARVGISGGEVAEIDLRTR